MLRLFRVLYNLVIMFNERTETTTTITHYKSLMSDKTSIIQTIDGF